MLVALRLLTELLTNLVLAGSVVWALLELTRGAGLPRVRLLIADGVLLALNLKVVATVLRTLEVTTWDQIGLLAAVFVLRTALKRVVGRERRLALTGHTGARVSAAR